MVCVLAVRIFSQTYSGQHLGWMPPDSALPGVCGLAFAVKLYERAEENGVFFRCNAVIAFERGFRFARHIGPAGRQFRIHRIAEVLRAPSPVGEIRHAVQIATAAVTGGNGAKRPVGFANDVKPAPCRAIIRACSVHGEVTWISNPLLEVKRASPLQDNWRDLNFAFAHMGLQPSRNVRRLPRRAGRARTRQGDRDTEADDVWKAQFQPHRIISPIDAFHAWPGAGTMTIAAPSMIRKSPDHLGRPLGLPKHWRSALKSAFY